MESFVESITKDLKDIHYFRVFENEFIVDVNSLEILEAPEDFKQFLITAISLFKENETQKLSEFLLLKKNNKYLDYIVLLKECEVFFNPPLEFSIDQPEPSLASVCINLTNACNMACTYCFTNLPKVKDEYGNNSNHMSKTTLNKAFEFAMKHSKERKQLGIAFFGGEPLLKFETLKYGVVKGQKEAIKNNKKITFGITTNGTLLDQEKIEYLNKNDIGLIVSLDGPEEIQDENRPFKKRAGKSYKTVKEKIDLLAELRGKDRFTIRSTFVKDQAGEFNQIVDFFEKEGFRSVSIENIFVDRKNILDFSFKEIELLKSQYNDFIRKYLNTILSDKYYRFFHFSVLLKRVFLKEKAPRECGAGTGYMAIAADGGVYPCHKFTGQKDYYMGNVFNGKINKEIGSGLWKLRVENKSKCSRCWARYACGGGCSADAAQFNGDHSKPVELYCELSKHRIKLTFWLYSKILDNCPEKLFKIFKQKRAVNSLKPEKKQGYEVNDKGEIVCVKSKSLRFQLNPTSLLVWQLCDGKRDVMSISEEVSRVFDVDIHLASMIVKKTINRFLDFKLVFQREEN